MGFLSRCFQIMTAASTAMARSVRGRNVPMSSYKDRLHNALSEAQCGATMRTTPRPKQMFLTETSSSDEDIEERAWVRHMRRRLDQKIMDAVGLEPEELPPTNESSDDEVRRQNYVLRSPSPPLYEVELTASDEDDDGSVLELVIPLQSLKYKRIQSTSQQIVEFLNFFCTILCCFR